LNSDEFDSELIAINCPVCKSKNTKVTQKILDIPHFTELWLFNIVCFDCHFKHNDFLNLSINEPIRYVYHAENKEDYETKIVRAANGTIIFPQIGAMIEPGPNAEGFINNIEGILQDIRGKTLHLLKDATDEQEITRIREYCELLNEYIEKNLPIDIVIEDPFGNSSIIPNDSAKLETHKLTQEEAEKLKTSFIVFEDVKK
jgi:zinc finger protein